MAVFPRGKKGVYYMDFIVYGQRVFRSTGKFTEKEAKKVEESERERIEKEIREGTYGKEKLTLLKGFERAYEERWKYTKDSVKVVSKYKRICTILGENTCLDALKNDDVSKLIKTLESKGVTLSTINRYLACLKTMLNMALNDWNEIREMPCKIKRFKEPKGRVRVITEEEEKAVIEYFKDIKEFDMADLILVLADTGCRLSEILNLPPKDVDLQKGMIYIWENKADEPRSVPMTGRVFEVMKRRGSRVFKGLSKDYVEKRWIKARKYLHLEHDKQFVIHALRHTCASRLVQGGVPLKHVQKWLGHKCYSTTERYTHFRPDSLLVAVKVLERN